MGYDTLLLLAVLFVATFVFLMLVGSAVHPPRQYLLQIWLLGVAGVYFAWFWAHGGQTLAMKTWKIRVIDQYGNTPGWQPVVTRYLLSVPSVLTGVGIVWALVDREGQFLHDRLAKTRLVLAT